MTEPIGINFTDLVQKIDKIIIKGETVKMKNKDKFKNTLLKTKDILKNEQDFFYTNYSQSPKMRQYLMDLESIIIDVESKLDKLAMISFCRDKAEKYLERVTEKLEQNNMVLLLQISLRKKEVGYDVQPLKDEINSLKIKLKELEESQSVSLYKHNDVENKPVNTYNVYNEHNDKILEGLRALMGVNGRVNYEVAYNYFKQVSEADNGNTEVKVLMAKMYEKGYYVDQSYQLAYELYKDAAERGNVQAMYMIGLYAENNFYGIFDKTENELNNFTIALKYYNEAAQRGYGDAVAKIGLALDKGTLHNKIDQEKALLYYEKAIEIDKNPMALNGIGGYNFKLNNFEAAYENFLLASQQNYPDAINNLGICYEYGKGVTQNLSKALDCYKRASKFNHANAIVNQGILLLKMDISAHSRKNFGEVLKLLLLGLNLDKGNKEAYFYLGFLFEIGYDLFGNKNLKPNYSIAFHFYKKAAELGHLQAKTKIGIARFNGIDNMFVSDEEKGISIVSEAAKEGDQNASIFLTKTTMLYSKIN